MRRMLWIIFIFILLTIGLNQDAFIPDRFTGVWYSTECEKAFLFQNGIIEQIYPTSTPNVDGAYCFTRNTITLYISDLDSLDTVSELYWSNRSGNDTLSGAPNRQARVYLARKK